MGLKATRPPAPSPFKLETPPAKFSYPQQVFGIAIYKMFCLLICDS